MGRGRRGGVTSALTDPKAKQRLEDAAAAAGVDLEGLVNLVVDSGALALPPADGVSESYSLDDLGEQMHAQMPPADRHEWFAELVETQRIAIVTMLRARGYSTVVVARDFGIGELEVNRIFSKYADDLGAQVINVRLNTLVGNLQLAAERAGEGAMEAKDWSTYWRIQKDLIALLQSLGIVKQAIRKVEVAHKFDDQKSAELTAMLDLERKQKARHEEMKTADFEVHDAVPVLNLPAAPGSMETKFEDET